MTLRNSITGAALSDVPMLLDSGADVTLVPRECVVRLGIPLDIKQGYELTGFDGNTSIAQVAELQMLLLGRTFRRTILADR